MYVADVRAMLLETVGQPPRLKQDHSLFQKEEERYLAVLDPFPTWMQGGAEQSVFDRIRVEKTLILVPAAGSGPLGTRSERLPES